MKSVEKKWNLIERQKRGPECVGIVVMESIHWRRGRRNSSKSRQSASLKSCVVKCEMKLSTRRPNSRLQQNRFRFLLRQQIIIFITLICSPYHANHRNFHDLVSRRRWDFIHKIRTACRRRSTLTYNSRRPQPTRCVFVVVQLSWMNFFIFFSYETSRVCERRVCASLIAKHFSSHNSKLSSQPATSFSQRCSQCKAATLAFSSAVELSRSECKGVSAHKNIPFLPKKK